MQYLWVLVCFYAYYSITRLTYFNANINSIRIKRDWSFLCISHEKCYMYDELWLIM